MATQINWQSVKVDYPETLYMYAYIYTKRGKEYVFANFAFESLKEMANAINFTIAKVGSGANEAINKDRVLVVKLRHEKDYGLKKSLWDEPEYHMDKIDRNSRFSQMIGKSDLFYVCTTALLEETESTNTKYTAAFTFYKSEMEDLNLLMQSSDFYVSPELKNVGIYEVKKVFEYDL